MEGAMRRTLLVVPLLAVTLAAPLALADAPPMAMLTPGDIKWGDVPPVFPKGAKMAVLYGDPSKPGELFIVRLKMQAGYKIPAHWHPTDENVTVISGTFNMGMGDKLDAAKTKAFPAGSFAVAPAKMNHFAIAKQAAIVEVSAIGPFAITYVNPADDPSKSASK
jgi:quercetin dioxygenase-like cupin family protein